MLNGVYSVCSSKLTQKANLVFRQLPFLSTVFKKALQRELIAGAVGMNPQTGKSRLAIKVTGGEEGETAAPRSN